MLAYIGIHTYSTCTMHFLCSCRHVHKGNFVQKHVACEHSPKKSANGSSVPKKSLKMSKAEWKWNWGPPVEIVCCQYTSTSDRKKKREGSLSQSPGMHAYLTKFVHGNEAQYSGNFMDRRSSPTTLLAAHVHVNLHVHYNKTTTTCTTYTSNV